jgi:hypothetical protein
MAHHNASAKNVILAAVGAEMITKSAMFSNVLSVRLSTHSVLRTRISALLLASLASLRLNPQFAVIALLRASPVLTHETNVQVVWQVARSQICTRKRALILALLKPPLLSMFASPVNHHVKLVQVSSRTA